MVTIDTPAAPAFETNQLYNMLLADLQPDPNQPRKYPRVEVESTAFWKRASGILKDVNQNTRALFFS